MCFGFNPKDIENNFSLARKNPLNKNCTDAEIALFIFYGMITDEELKANGDTIRRNFWLTVNQSRYGVKSVVQEFLKNQDNETLFKTGLCVQFSDQNLLDKVEKHCENVVAKYPDYNYNLDNYRIGKLGEWAVYEVLRKILDVWKERSIYQEPVGQLG